VISIASDVSAEVVKTGTTTVGIVCKEGIVLAADRRATAGNFIADKKAQKVIQVSDHMAVTIAGLVSDAQLLAKLIKAELKLKDIQTNRQSSVREAASMLAGMSYSNIRRMSMVPGVVGFLIGGHDNEGDHLYEIGIDGSIHEVEDFVSDGSGCVYALGVLETVYKKGLSLDEGVKLAVKCINAALQRDNCTGNGIVVVTINEKGVQEVLQREIITKIEV